MRRLTFITLLVLTLTALTTIRSALAHPLDVYLQSSYITIGTDQVEVEIDLSPGVLIVPNIIADIDTNGDETISDAEATAYANLVVSQIDLQVDGQSQLMTVTAVDMPDYLNIQAGFGLIKITAAANVSATGTHSLTFTNNYAPTGSAWQVNTFVESGATINLGTQNRDDLQQSMTLAYGTDATAGSASTDSAVTVSSSDATSSTARTGRLLGYLDDADLSTVGLMLALGLALVVGALHALTPGHGKTLVATYLVGSRGTVRHAAYLGAIVTFTHTASVIVIGLIALFASHWIMPDVLVPALQVVSGALVVWVGGRLLIQCWRLFRLRNDPDAKHAYQHAQGMGHSHDHVHEHEHEHEHEHQHEHEHGLTHTHGGSTHTHLPPADALTPRGLLALGISGGIVPCPEALGIMILAVGLNKIALGLGMIVAFSIGLAGILIALGIVLVRSRSMLDRFTPAGMRMSVSLPLVSSLLVTVLGLGMLYGGLHHVLA